MSMLACPQAKGPHLSDPLFYLLPPACLPIKPSSGQQDLSMPMPWPHALLTMRTPPSFSTSAANPSPPPLPPLLPHAHAEEQQAISVDSDTVVILASLLCALICVAGLALVARCACRRTSVPTATIRSGGGLSTQPPRGLKKAAIEALPTVSLTASSGRRDEEGECAICLAVFTEGDELRMLPHCAHGFHAACIDTWLGAHASCPTCRATIVVSAPLCRRCGAACGDLDVAAAVPGGPEHAATAVS
ncbi:hypothetical protein BS78_04G330600 [Paspalum vaginatum]|nr:hypothetical protein BS78_04G330600 [Paspalum vaginatum]